MFRGTATKDNLAKRDEYYFTINKYDVLVIEKMIHSEYLKEINW